MCFKSKLDRSTRRFTGWKPKAGSHPRGRSLTRESEQSTYGLTKSGRKQLVTEQSKWEQLTIAMARVLRPAE